MRRGSDILLGFVALLLFVGALFVSDRGLKDILGQHREITTARPVAAEVRSVEVNSRMTGGKNRHRVYWPVIEFGYVVDGIRYHSSRLTPVFKTGGQDWARGLGSAYRAGQNVTAWYSPLNPQGAFLLPEYQTDPYFLATMGFALFLGSLLMGWYVWARRSLLPRHTGNGLTELAPSWPLGTQQIQMFAVGTLALAGFGAIMGHYFTVAGDSVTGGDYAFAGGLLGVPLFMLGRGWWLAATRSDVFEARVQVDAWPVALGKPLAVSVTQVVRRDLAVQRVSVETRCVLRRGKHTRQVWSEEQFQHEGVQVVAGQTLRSNLTFELPASVEQEDGRQRTGLTWSLIVWTALEKRPDYKAEFRLEVV